MDAPLRLRRAPSRRGWFIGATMVVAALGVGAYLFSEELVDRPHSQRRVGPDEIEGDTPSAGPKPFDPPASRGAGPTGNAALPSTVTVEVEGAPPDLQVLVDGDNASLPVRLPRDGAVHKFVFKAPGFQSETRIIEASRSEVVQLSLRPAKEASDDGGNSNARPAARPPIQRPVRRRPPPPSTKPRRGDDVIIDI